MRLMIILLVMLCIGCSSPDSVARKPSSVSDKWSVAIMHSGGIAGITRKSVIREDGLILHEKGKRQVVSSKADKKKLRALDSAIRKISTVSKDKKRSSLPYGRLNKCRDCFYTTIEVSKGGDKIYQTSFISGKPHDSQAAELLEIVEYVLKQ